MLSHIKLEQNLCTRGLLTAYIGHKKNRRLGVWNLNILCKVCWEKVGWRKQHQESSRLVKSIRCHIVKRSFFFQCSSWKSLQMYGWSLLSSFPQRYPNLVSTQAIKKSIIWHAARSISFITCPVLQMSLHHIQFQTWGLLKDT